MKRYFLRKMLQQWVSFWIVEYKIQSLLETNVVFRDKFSIWHARWIPKFWSLFLVSQQPLLSACCVWNTTQGLVNETIHQTILWQRMLEYKCFLWWYYISFISSNHFICFLFFLILLDFPFLFINTPKYN